MVTTVVVKMDYDEVVNSLVNSARDVAGEKVGGAKVMFMSVDGTVIPGKAMQKDLSVVVEFTAVNHKG